MSNARRGQRQILAIGGAVFGCLLTVGCTSAPGPTQATPSAPARSVATAPLAIDITIAGGQVEPNGRKIDVKVGQAVVLSVRSDADDEIHAHIGGDGYELAVKAGQPTTGRFTLDSAGSFEVESHHLEKVIVILNAR